jgi:hypothetical protein
MDMVCIGGRDPEVNRRCRRGTCDGEGQILLRRVEQML